MLLSCNKHVNIYICNIVTETKESKMTGKTYRLKKEVADLALEKMINYITEKRAPITESEIINIAAMKGLETLKNDEIAELLKKQKRDK